VRNRRPGGPDDRIGPALARLCVRRRRAKREADADRLRGRERGRGGGDGRRDVPPPPREPGDGDGELGAARRRAAGRRRGGAHVTIVARRPRVAVIVFPGTWSERDFTHVATEVLDW